MSWPSERESGEPPVDPDAIVPRVEEVRAIMLPLVEAYCEHAIGCCNDDELSYYLGPVTNVGDCAERIIARLERGNAEVPLVTGRLGWRAQHPLVGILGALAAMEYVWDKSRIALNETAVEACAAHVRDGACGAAPGRMCDLSAPTPSFNPCAEGALLTGLVEKEGEYLPEASHQCRNGLACRYLPGSRGVCRAPSPEGDPCAYDFECLAPLVCQAFTGRCGPGKSVGEACEYAAPAHPQPGTETVRCGAGLACDPNLLVCAPHSCITGASCVTSSECLEGLTCLGGFCAVLADDGEACSSDAQCRVGSCRYVPSANSQECVSPAPNGTTCGFHGDCESHVCDFWTPGGTLVCAPARADGAGCNAGEQCSSGRCRYDDVQATSLCVLAEALGAPCSLDEECNRHQGHRCLSSVCRRTEVADGGECEEATQCQSGTCRNGTCGASTAAGGSCGATGDCLVGLYCDTELAEPVCVPRKTRGARCTSREQCWGDCEVAYGVTRCSGVSPTEKVCGGD